MSGQLLTPSEYFSNSVFSTRRKATSWDGGLETPKNRKPRHQEQVLSLRYRYSARHPHPRGGRRCRLEVELTSWDLWEPRRKPRRTSEMISARAVTNQEWAVWTEASPAHRAKWSAKARAHASFDMSTPADENAPRIAWTERWQEAQAVGGRREERMWDEGRPKLRQTATRKTAS
jgi:hypothetical protein